MATVDPGSLFSPMVGEDSFGTRAAQISSDHGPTNQQNGGIMEGKPGSCLGGLGETWRGRGTAASAVEVRFGKCCYGKKLHNMRRAGSGNE